MKSPLYVAAVTDFYRKALDGNLTDPDELLSDIQTLFGRPSTDLYLDNPQNVPVDPVNDGHRGALIGTVKASKGPWLILHSNRALQKHDGIKFENGCGFAADEMRLASDPEGKRRFELPADAEIALKLPADHPVIGTGSPVYCSYSQTVRQRYEFSAPRPGQFRQRRPVNIHINHTFESVVLSASADGLQSDLILNGPFEAAKNPEKAVAAIRQCFEKLGDTDWRLGELTIQGSPVFVPVSVLNDARRRLIEQFSNLWKKTLCRNTVASEPWKKTGADGFFWSVKSRSFQCLEEIDEFVLEMDPAHPEEIEKALAFYGEKLRLALPVIIRDEDAEIFKTLIGQFSTRDEVERGRYAEGVTAATEGSGNVWKWEAANVGGLNLLQGKKDITADWPLYTLNTQAALQWGGQGVQLFVLSPEDDEPNWTALIAQLGGAAIVPVYQHTPLMISATKPAAGGDCLTDRAGRRFHVEPAGREFVLFDETPFSLTGHLDELKALGARRFRIDLSYGASSPELVQRIISGQSVPGHTGNFGRELQ
jgi:hypothetical protein